MKKNHSLIPVPKTIDELKKNDKKFGTSLYDEFLRQQMKSGVTFKEYVKSIKGSIIIKSPK